jgi:hypothetical protein
MDDRKFMLQAVEEANHSKSEDGRISPKVGVGNSQRGYNSRRPVETG